MHQPRVFSHYAVHIKPSGNNSVAVITIQFKALPLLSGDIIAITGPNSSILTMDTGELLTSSAYIASSTTPGFPYQIATTPLSLLADSVDITFTSFDTNANRALAVLYTADDACPLGLEPHKASNLSHAAASANVMMTSDQTLLRPATCVPCAAGFHRSSRLPLTCVACDIGSYSAVSGAVNCTPCAAGTFANTTGMSTCLPCAVGQYQLNASAASCIACGLGSFSSAPGATHCLECSAPNITATPPFLGTYSDVIGGSTCSVPLMRYVGRTDFTSCNASQDVCECVSPYVTDGLRC